MGDIPCSFTTNRMQRSPMRTVLCAAAAIVLSCAVFVAADIPQEPFEEGSPAAAVVELEVAVAEDKKVDSEKYHKALKKKIIKSLTPKKKAPVKPVNKKELANKKVARVVKKSLKKSMNEVKNLKYVSHFEGPKVVDHVTGETKSEVDDEEDKHYGAKNSLGVNRILGKRKFRSKYQTREGMEGLVRPPGYVTADTSQGPQGHYYLGPSRRRIGAGFGRRRRHIKPPSKKKLALAKRELARRKITRELKKKKLVKSKKPPPKVKKLMKWAKGIHFSLKKSLENKAKKKKAEKAAAKKKKAKAAVEAIAVEPASIPRPAATALVGDEVSWHAHKKSKEAKAHNDEDPPWDQDAPWQKKKKKAVPASVQTQLEEVLSSRRKA